MTHTLDQLCNVRKVAAKSYSSRWSRRKPLHLGFGTRDVSQRALPHLSPETIGLPQRLAAAARLSLPDFHIKSRKALLIDLVRSDIRYMHARRKPFGMDRGCH